MAEKKIKRNAIKIAMLGDSMVGKTAICNTFMNIEFNDNNLSTIGMEKLESQMTLNNGEEIKLIIWDTAGQERFRSIALKSIKTAQGVVIVFDLTQKRTFLNVVNWLKEINEKLNNVCIVLFGNKCDIDEDKWEVTKDEVMKFVEKNGLTYFETSAKEDINIKEGFKNVVNAAYEKYEGTTSGIQLDKNIETKKNQNAVEVEKQREKRKKQIRKRKYKLNTFIFYLV
jgi:small GTP-binding protein